MFARDVLWFYSLGRENDVLRDEGEAHGRKLAAARRSGRLVRYDGTIHDFMLLDPIANTFPGALDQGQGCPALVPSQ